MRSITRCVFILYAFIPVRTVFADATATDSGELRVDVVVDMTDAGRKVPHPSPEHPAYYYPVVKGYTPGGQILAGEKPPSSVADVEHLAAVALAKQGYLLAKKESPPTLLLIFWWGYKAPEVVNDDKDRLGASDPADGTVLGGPGARMSINQLANRGLLPTNTVVNHVEMEELVMGTKFDPEPLHNLPNPREENATDASRQPRYYLMVSALDFKDAIEQKKSVVYWTARISTELTGHTLEQVLPTLITEGTPAFGRGTNGPQFSSEPVVPMGRVIVGVPVLKTDSRQPSATIPSSNP
jgi:hypothetical protein